MGFFLFLFLAANIYALGHAMGRANPCPTCKHTRRECRQGSSGSR